MRSRIFRVLAGLLCVGFVWFLTTTDHVDRDLRELVGAWAICTVFGLFAIFGAGPAEKMLGLLFGVPDPESPNLERGTDDEQPPRSVK